jgi:dihydrofolate synthase/folylpolyglutamate synthase
MRIRSFVHTNRYFDCFKDLSRLVTPELYETYADNLARFRGLLAAHGDPHLGFASVHVAGSKAKGSTSTLIASVLTASGRRTGLTTSPHIVDRAERISIDGTAISHGEFAALAEEVRRWFAAQPEHSAAAEGLRLALCRVPGLRRLAPGGDPKRVFEIMTAMGFLYFARSGVDAVVTETGIGGRVDATNVFDAPGRNPRPLVDVITLIGLEHTQTLGRTVEAIAGHKAGILRGHALGVIAPQHPQWGETVRRIMDERAAGVGMSPLLDAAQCIEVAPDSVRLSPKGTTASYRADVAAIGRWTAGLGARADGAAQRGAPLANSQLLAAVAAGMELTTALAGRHQVENTRTALAALLALEAGGMAVSPDAVRRGLAAARIPARFEVMCDDPLVVLDCCHEPLSAAAFGAAYRDIFGNRPAVGLCGFLRDKPHAEMLRLVGDGIPFVRIVCCSPSAGVRSRSAAKSALAAHKLLGVPAEAVEDPAAATVRALRLLRPGDALVVFGMIGSLAAVRTAFARGIPAGDLSPK